MIEKTAVGPVASLRLYTCSPLHAILDYREVMWTLLFKFLCVGASVDISTQ